VTPTATLVAALALASPPGGRPAAAADAVPILAAARKGRAYDLLASLADTVGPRLAGSPGAEAAVRWAAEWFRQNGFEVRLEPVRVRRWVRGEERAEVLSAGAGPGQALAVTALGNSPPTPPGGAAGEVVEVGSLEELRALGDGVRGRVVLFQHDMKQAADYGRFAPLRMRGPAEAARLGAAAALVRSLATASLRTPHTGATLFPAGGPRVPAAAVSVEDAELLHRLLQRGPVKVRLVLGCGAGEPAEVESANVVAELRGRERPEEVVVVGAHIDSWDLGAGAVDDGAGVAMVMEALRIAKAQPSPPRRTLRAVLFMNEENGLDGGVGYYRAHRAEGDRHVAAVEADGGAGRPTGVRVTAGQGGIELVQAWARPLAALGADRVSPDGGGADISPLAYARVPRLSIEQDASRYFDWHHSAADTLDKVDPRELSEATAALAWIAWSLADAAETLPRPLAPESAPSWATEPPGTAPGAPAGKGAERR